MAWRELARRSAFRVAVLYSVLITGSGIVVLGIVYWQTAGALMSEVDARIGAEMEVLVERYRQTGVPGLAMLISQRLSRGPAGDDVYLLQDPQGRRVAGNLTRWPDERPDDTGFVAFQLGSEPDLLETLRPGRGRAVELAGGYRLLVGRDMLEVRAFQERVLGALGRAMAVTVLLALVTALLVGRKTGSRVARMNAAIDEIVSGDLSRRLPTRPEGDEIDDLAEHVNGMLDRIQELMIGVRQVSDNIAHDLRTPLARLKRRLEAAVGENGGGDRSHVALREALEEANGLLGTFGALLRIGRIEAERRRAGFTEVDIALLVGDVAELYEPVAEEVGKGLEGSVEGSLSVEGDRDLLFQAVANLVDNAIKHAPAGRTVQIHARPIGAAVELSVVDDGPGIPAADRERVFQRLVRLDDSRSTPGCGLGLSLVAAVARLHEGEAAVEDNEPGVRAILRLPARPGVALSVAS